MALKIPLSFKDTEKEMYDFVKNQLSYSIYLKGLIQKDMGLKENNKPNKKQNNDFQMDF